MSPMSVRWFWFVLGGLTVVVALLDAVGTLVTTRSRKGKWWPTNWFYRVSWKLWRRIGLRMRDEDRREQAFTAYGPLSLLFLLVIWVGLEIIGWGLVWFGMREQFNGIGSLADGWYFAGVNFFTVGFGDIVPVETPARMLVIVAAFTGITTSALVIGFLPTLYGAYSRREQQLLLLDDLSGRYVTPIGLIDAYASPGDLSELYRLLQDWERWVADVMESHTAYRMLVLFRSRRTGQSWLMAVGILTDTAVTLMATVRGAGEREALLFYRRATELLATLAGQFRSHGGTGAFDELDEADFRERYDHLVRLGFDLRPFDLAWDAIRQLRSGYIPHLAGLTEALLAPTRYRNPEVLYPEVLARLATEAEEDGTDDGDLDQTQS